MSTRQPWFGPKHVAGWGWTPITWQGWLATAVFVAVLGAAVAYFRASLTALIIGLVVFAAYFGVILLTGAKPGGPHSN